MSIEDNTIQEILSADVLADLDLLADFLDVSRTALVAQAVQVFLEDNEDLSQARRREAVPVIVETKIVPAGYLMSGNVMARCVMSDGTTLDVVAWFDDELTITPEMLTGLTKRQAIALKLDLDADYLRS